ncbi:nuclear transport factor 2 family protein [Pseudoalteromonas ostreae]|nr:nuclear transport factor 2 family protein [Pseudoalteromonas ostreae]
MKKITTIFSVVLMCVSISVAAANKELETLAQQYFSTMVATQAPSATHKELEAFLALLSDDVGSQHIPFQPDDTRTPDGKENMRKGMAYYLGAHTEYKAKLLDTFIFNNSGFAIRYSHHPKGIHPQNQQPIEYTQTIMDVLEVEGGKIVMIRKYHQ